MPRLCIRAAPLPQPWVGIHWLDQSINHSSINRPTPPDQVLHQAGQAQVQEGCERRLARPAEAAPRGRARQARAVQPAPGAWAAGGRELGCWALQGLRGAAPGRRLKRVLPLHPARRVHTPPLAPVPLHRPSQPLCAPPPDCHPGARGDREPGGGRGPERAADPRALRGAEQRPVQEDADARAQGAARWGSTRRMGAGGGRAGGAVRPPPLPSGWGRATPQLQVPLSSSPPPPRLLPRRVPHGPHRPARARPWRTPT